MLSLRNNMIDISQRITPNSMILGRIARVSADEILLDLPNNLTGTVPITQISTQLIKRLEATIAAQDDAEEDNQDIVDADLRDYFKLGQYLRTCVTSTTDDSGPKARKRIELSIAPQKTNVPLTSTTISTNCMLQASIASIEDHGLIMDLGLETADVKGFLSKKDIPQGIDYQDMKLGMVFLCLVTGLNANGKVVKLSANRYKAGNLQKSNALTDAPTIDGFLPGTAVEVLISQITSTSVAGEVFGTLTATADIVHCGAAPGIDLASKYKVGSKLDARVIYILSDTQTKTLGVSFLHHLLSLEASKSLDDVTIQQELALSSYIDHAKIVKVESGLGLFLDIGIKDIRGFAHMSRISDKKIASLDQTIGPYRLDTTHKARVVGYNAFDKLYLVSLQQSVLDQAFLRVEDIPIGERLTVKVEKLLLNASGIMGVIVELAQGLTGLVPEMHMADVHLEHPERKFKEGSSFAARVLSTDVEKRQVRLTMKKTLLNSSLQRWTEWSKIALGEESIGTIVNIIPHGAVMQFYGNVKGFLPVSEFSDAFVKDPSKHFREGQTLTVHAKSVDPQLKRLTLSARTVSATEAADLEAIEVLKVGQTVDGVVSAKTLSDITIDLKESTLKATMSISQLTDGSEAKNASVAKQIRVGQTLQDLTIIELFPQKKSVVVSKKPSFLKAAKDKTLIKAFDDIQRGKTIKGFVRNITSDGVFIGFADGLTGLLPKLQIAEDQVDIPEYGMFRGQTISATVFNMDIEKQRFVLTMRPKPDFSETESTKILKPLHVADIVNPVDVKSTSMSDFALGKITQGRITSVKESQLNIQLADNLQGRIDVSEAFESWEDIKDPKIPLKQYKAKDIVDVRVLGIHDARNHKFLPISHRGGKAPVFECSTRLKPDSSMTSLDQVVVGNTYSAFVNNISESCLWVNLSPNVRGRIELMELSDDVSLLSDLEKNFPFGSALQVRVIKIDAASGHLDLSAKSSTSEEPLTLETISQGMVIPGRVTKTNERSVFVHLSPTVAGVIGLTELEDDFEKADPSRHNKNDIIRVCVLNVDKSNKQVVLSTRPSKVLSSALPVKDRSLSDLSTIKANDLVRGFIKNVADVGLFVSLSYKITAFVRVSAMFDTFQKDWKSNFEIDRLVSGKVISVDEATGRIQMSLKPSVVSTDYAPPVAFNDLKVGQVVSGKVRKVEDFGAFIVVDNSHNVSGLCHRSEIAEQRIEDVRKIYSEGDAVKAVVLNIDAEKRRISFGLKASYFENDSETDDSEDDEGGLEPLSENEDMADAGGIAIDVDEDILEDAQSSSDDSMSDAPDIQPTTAGLNVGPLDLSGAFPFATRNSPTPPPNTTAPLKKRSKRPTITTDLTATLDGPPTTPSDFERLLLTSRDSASLWIQYMAYHLGLASPDSARSIADRALRTIDIRDEASKLDVWTALLNLEASYGSPESLDAVFARACAAADPVPLHTRLAQIHIGAGKLADAEKVFAALLARKGPKPPSLWLNYATFLMSSVGDAERARAVLPRAQQSVPSGAVDEHRRLLLDFATLEFRAKGGSAERGRTLFEGLFDAYPRRGDHWDVLVELERARGEDGNVRALYERMAGGKMKRKRANGVFKRWLEFEEGVAGGDRQKRVDHVKAKAVQYVEKMKEKGEDE